MQGTGTQRNGIIKETFVQIPVSFVSSHSVMKHSSRTDDQDAPENPRGLGQRAESLIGRWEKSDGDKTGLWKHREVIKETPTCCRGPLSLLAPSRDAEEATALLQGRWTWVDSGGKEATCRPQHGALRPPSNRFYNNSGHYFSVPSAVSPVLKLFLLYHPVSSIYRRNIESLSVNDQRPTLSRTAGQATLWRRGSKGG